MQKIFIVEDDTTIVSSLRKAFSDEFQVSSATNFRAVRQEIEKFSPDLILMDIGLPFYSGFYWTEKLRESSKTPIIFISSASDDMNQIMAMNQGADDFVTKPFSVEVLRAKIHAILRRTEESKLTWNGFELSNSTIQIDSFECELSTAENKMMTLLFKAKGGVVKKEDLLQELWQTDEFIDSNALAVRMTRLRKKLEDIGFDEHIVSKRGVGYALV